jgi:hypothetical protein
MGQFLQQELNWTEERLQFVMAKMSVAFASRNRVQRRFFDLIMPHNREVLSQIAQDASLKAKHELTSGTSEGSTRLGAFLEELRAVHVEVAVVAMPSADAYGVPAMRVELVQAAGARWIDLRAVSGISRNDYYDSAHLDHDGAVKLTSALSDALDSEAAPTLNREKARGDNHHE